MDTENTKSIAENTKSFADVGTGKHPITLECMGVNEDVSNNNRLMKKLIPCYSVEEKDWLPLQEPASQEPASQEPASQEPASQKTYSDFIGTSPTNPNTNTTSEIKELYWVKIEDLSFKHSMLTFTGAHHTGMIMIEIIISY